MLKTNKYIIMRQVNAFPPASDIEGSLYDYLISNKDFRWRLKFDQYRKHQNCMSLVQPIKHKHTSNMFL